MREVGRKPRRLEHVLAIRRVGAVGADAYAQAARQHRAHRRHARAEPQIAHRVVDCAAACVRQARDIVVVDPDRVRGAEALFQEPECGEMRSEALAVFFVANDGLGFRFSEMRLQPHVIVASEVAARDPEIIGAMQRNSGRKRRPDAAPVMAPSLQDAATDINAGMTGRSNHSAYFVPYLLGHGLNQSRKGVEEAAVGHHGRHDGAHADVMIGLRHSRDAFGRWQRKLDGEIIGGGAAALHHLDSTKSSRKILVLSGAVAADASRCAEKYFKGHAIADEPLAQPPMAVGVAIDQAGHEQAIGGVKRLGILGSGHAGRTDTADGVVLDQDVGVVGPPRLHVEHTAMPNDEPLHAREGYEI
jgi:hypothetical protein